MEEFETKKKTWSKASDFYTKEAKKAFTWDGNPSFLL
jgi:hypothetical protein